MGTEANDVHDNLYRDVIQYYDLIRLTIFDDNIISSISIIIWQMIIKQEACIIFELCCIFKSCLMSYMVHASTSSLLHRVVAITSCLINQILILHTLVISQAFASPQPEARIQPPLAFDNFIHQHPAELYLYGPRPSLLQLFHG